MLELEYNKYLPPYRLLLNPSVTYDYQTHRSIQLSPLDIKNIIAKFKQNQLQTVKTPFQMKYRSLLSDVSIKASLLSRKVSGLRLLLASIALAPPNRRCRSFKQLPIEIQLTIFTYIDDHHAYRNCLYVCKRFYQLAKPFLLRSVSFTSSYRFAQFLTCLRLNLALGSFVLEIDLSDLKPGNWEADLDELANMDLDDSDPDVIAGWRDWKFKNNLYALHPVAIPLTRSLSNVAANTQSPKRAKLSKYFKRRKSSTQIPQKEPEPHTHQHGPQHGHPRANRFLLNYAASRDVPVGYILHLINLCPNLQSLNLANLSLSTDYRVAPAVRSKYQVYDLMNNYHKDMLSIVESLAPEASLREIKMSSTGMRTSIADSSVSSVFSFSKPVRKYNSLLPPIPTADIYTSRGDGQLFLSDLNLKSINTNYLEIISQSEIFDCLKKRGEALAYLNMSSVIWINVKLVRDYLNTVLAADILQQIINGRERLLYKNEYYELGELIEAGPPRKNGFVLDLSNSGMNKNLPWAQSIDSRCNTGRKLIHHILNDELVSRTQEYLITQRIRRGRVGENYFV